VNERKRSRSANAKRAVQLDAQAARLRPSRARSIARADDNSIIVFCGDAQQVRDGFALALDAMEANADSLMMGTEQLPKGEWRLACNRSAMRRAEES
jgi:hypothetical protein